MLKTLLGRPSIQLRLFAFLSLIIILTAAASGTASFFAMLEEAQEFQDDMLKQTAVLTVPDQLPENAGYADIDSDTRIYIQPLAEQGGRFNIAHLGAEGFYDITAKNKPYRAYVHAYPGGRLVAFIQETEFRDEAAADSAWYAVIPLLLLVPAALVLTALIIYLTLRPIRQLSQQTEQRSENDLSPLPTGRVPLEVYGLVNAVNRLFARVDENMRRQQRFIADAAHELRSPMTALSLQAERLSSRGLPEETAALVDNLREGIRRNRHLLEQLLSMARAQAKENRPRRPVDLAGLYRNLIQDLYPLADAKNIDLGTEGEPNIQLLADETEIYTLLKTLIDNAIRYTPAGGRIDLRARLHEGGCLIEVEDNGSGIPAEERARVFDPFYRILGSGTEGSGLGLAIAKTIAGRYGGTVTLSDAKRFPSGLNAAVWLPQTDAALAREEYRPSEKQRRAWHFGRFIRKTKPAAPDKNG